MRVKGGTVTRARRKKVLKRAKGYFGSKHLLYRTAHEQVMHSLHYAYVSRRLIKRDFRKLWIVRINAACRNYGINYSTLMQPFWQSFYYRKVRLQTAEALSFQAEVLLPKTRLL